MDDQQQYYIVSVKHTSAGDAALTFFCADNCGYTWHKKRAGLYSKEDAERFGGDEWNVQVEKEKVDPFWMNALDFNDEYISVPNTATVRLHLGLSSKNMKPKKHASCRMTFLNTPIDINS